MNINEYTCIFGVKCPNNEKIITYSLTIETDEMIMVEEIRAACDSVGASYHEPMADALRTRFGGKQTLVAQHHGVGIKTIRS